MALILLPQQKPVWYWGSACYWQLLIRKRERGGVKAKAYNWTFYLNVRTIIENPSQWLCLKLPICESSNKDAAAFHANKGAMQQNFKAWLFPSPNHLMLKAELRTFDCFQTQMSMPFFLTSFKHGCFCFVCFGIYPRQQKETVTLTYAPILSQRFRRPDPFFPIFSHFHPILLTFSGCHWK